MIRCLCLLLCAFAPALAHAAGKPPSLKPLTLAIRAIIPRARAQAPQTVDVRINCNSPKLFTGRLELKWYVGYPGKRLVHEYVSNELTVTEGGLTFRMQVPPIALRAEKTVVSVGTRFIMDREVIELDEPPVPTFLPVWKRAFVMAVVQPQEQLLRQSERDAARERGAPFERSLVDSLNLEQFNPIGASLPQAEIDSSLDMLTYPSRLTPEDMPTSPAGYSSFDLLFLEGPGFEQLNAKQLVAMGQWVVAGGRAVVWPSGKLTKDHVRFLNRLAERSASGGELPEPRYGLDERGRLVISDAARARSAKYARYRSGLGRSLVIHESLEPGADLGTPEWKGAVSFLWSVREGQIEPVTKSGFWRFEMPPMRLTEKSNRPYEPQADELPRAIRQFLLPDRIEGVPLSVVVVILGLYLMAIAPVDYFLLGRFNCRKFTWGVFALVSAVFTFCTVLVAKSYMGQADYHTSLIVADVIDSEEPSSPPEVVRSNRFDMLFVAQQSVVEIPVKGAIYADLTNRAVISERLEREYDRRAFFVGDTGEMDVSDSVITDLPVFSGVMPSAFSVHQQMRQWSPRINRRTTLSDDGDLLAGTKIDWAGLRPDNWHTPAGQRALRDAILAKEPGAQILLFHENRMDDISGEPLDVTSAEPEMQRRLLLASLVQAISARAATGFFSVVSQVAPTGGEYLEDLSLLDSSDSRQWLLAVAVRRDNEWLVYRKLCRE